MEKVTYALKQGNEYIQIPFKGERTIHLTDSLLDCTHFKSKIHAAGTLNYLFSLPENYLIDPNIQPDMFNVVKMTFHVREEFVE